MAGVQLKRSSCIKRKRSDLSLDLRDAIKKLNLLSDRINSVIDDLPNNVTTLVELVQAQTKMIESLAAHHQDPSNKRQSSEHSSRTITSESIYGNLPASHSSPALVESPISACSDDLPATLNVQRSRIRVPEIRSPVPSRRQSSKVAEIVHTPPTPPSSPPPPSVPQKDAGYTESLAPMLRSSSRSSFLSVNTNISTTSTMNSPLSLASCIICDTQPWDLLNKPDPRTSDLTCESHVLEATANLIANMKEKKRTPIGPLDGGVFHLYSADYRRHYCVHDRPDRQSLLVYSQSETWEADFPGVPPPQKGEVAMELVVYPDCLLIVKPFKVPRHAGWKWHTLDAIGDDARPTSIEVMFLGGGFIKVRVRLSELLGEHGMEAGEPERFIEFSGIWTVGEKRDDDAVMSTTVSRTASPMSSVSSSAMCSRMDLSGFGLGIEGAKEKESESIEIMIHDGLIPVESERKKEEMKEKETPLLLLPACLAELES